MTLKDDVKVALRVGSNAYDSEIDGLIAAAKSDLERVGIKNHLINQQEVNPLVKQAIVLYAKANFGYDNNEAMRFMNSYHQTVCDLMNSSANSADKCRCR